MTSYAIVHRTRGLLEVVDGVRAEAVRAAADLTDGSIWLDQGAPGLPVEAYARGLFSGLKRRVEVVVVPCEIRDGQPFTVGTHEEQLGDD